MDGSPSRPVDQIGVPDLVDVRRSGVGDGGISFRWVKLRERILDPDQSWALAQVLGLWSELRFRGAPEPVERKFENRWSRPG